MKKSRTVSLISGGLVVALGIALLMGVAGLVENTLIYMWALPLLFILGGCVGVWGTPKAKASVSYGLIATGLITLFVRLGWINGVIVNALLAGALIATGSIMLARISEKTDTKQ